jgi:hypothetical protein
MMKGWAIFVRVGTDYSGFGSTQYEITEELLSEYESEGIINVEEMRIGEERFQNLIEKNHGEFLPGDSEIPDREPTYAGMTLREMSKEGKRVEFKREFPGTDELSKEIAALANTDGGVILLGVNDNGEVVGLDNPQEVQSRIEGLTTSSKFRPPLYPEFYILQMEEGENILLIEVEELDSPCALNYRYYSRVGTSVEKQLYE